MSVYILDCETSGVSKSDQVIELAYHKCAPLQDYLNEVIDISFINGVTECTHERRYLPSCPINPHAHAVHGITRAMLASKPLASSISLPKEVIYIIGHNIQFDKRLLIQSNPELSVQLEQVNYICTLNLAKLISKYKGITYENHKLDILTKHYYPDHLQLVTPIHSAKNDVVKNLLVLLKLVEHLPSILTWDDLYTTQEKIKEVK